jgi:3-methylcrotonyl-CoA carboxylase alpha subunit
MLGEPEDDDVWSSRTAWRLQGNAWTKRTLDGPEGPAEVAVRATAEGWAWQALDVDGPKTRHIGVFSAHQPVVPGGGGVWVVDPDVGPVRFVLAADDADAADHGEASLEAPMPGTVVQLRVEPGAGVREGETLVVMESMKMEISIAAPRDGSVAEVLVAAGDQVDRGATLIELAEEPAG